MKIHKLSYNPHRLICGSHDFRHSDYFWKNVTCKKCLAKKPKIYNYKKKIQKEIVGEIIEILENEYCDLYRAGALYCASKIRKKYLEGK